MNGDNNKPILGQQSVMNIAETYFAKVEPALKAAITSIIGNLVHELQAQKVELEIQNEEIWPARVKLEQVKAHYQDLYDFAPVGYLTLDNEGIIQEINLTAAKLLHNDRSNIINRHFANFIADENKDLWKQHFQWAKNSDGRYGCELPFKGHDDATVYYHLDCLFVNNHGMKDIVRITLTDISERKRMEHDLRIAATAFETQDCIVIADADKKILRVNEAFSRVTGYSGDDLTGLSLFNEKQHENDFFKTLWAKVPKNGLWRGELWENRKNGESFLMAVNINAVRDDQGYITHYVGDFIDITKQRTAEEKLSELNYDFIAFLDNTSDFVYAKDLDNRFRFCSNSMARLVGFDRWQDVVGKGLFELFPQEAAKIYIEAELSVYKQGTPLLNQLEPYHDEEGRQGWVYTSKWPQLDQDGNVVGIFGISRDVTEQHMLEQALSWSEDLNRKILQAFPAHIAVIDAQGIIITVNESWTKFAQNNTSSNAPEELSVGANYLDVCRRATDEDAARALAGIESVLSGTSEQFTMEYPCDSPQENRWFSMCVVQLIQNDKIGAVIAHQNITAHKQAEAQLTEAEQRWRFALQAANLGSWVMNLADSTVWRSNRHGEIFGYQEPLPDWSYEIFLQHVLQEERTTVDQCIQTAIAAHQDYSFECRIRRVDGKVCWISVYAKYSKECPELMFGLVEDITDRKNSDILLLESEARYRHVLETQTEIICRHRPDGTMLLVNQAFCRLFGKSKAELEGRKWQPIVWSEDLPMVIEKLNTLTPANPIVTIENRVIAAQGEVRWGQFVNRAFFDERGQWVETQTVGRDITDSKRAEEELRIAAVAFETQEAIIVADADRSVHRVNKAFSRLTGYSHEEAKRLPFINSSLAAPDFYNTIWASVLRNGYWQGEIWHNRKNGNAFPAWYSIAVTKDTKGEITHFIASFLDITAQKQAEKVLLDEKNRLENQVTVTQDALEKNKQEISEVNAALKVVLNHQDARKLDAVAEFSNEVELTVLPMLEKLKNAAADPKKTALLVDVLETDLKQLFNSYGRSTSLTSAFQRLTPIERKVAEMIKKGCVTKEIASALNLAPLTIDVHRKHIRKKLGLSGKSGHLYSYLLSLTE